jgi:hypothetical protein
VTILQACAAWLQLSSFTRGSILSMNCLKALLVVLNLHIRKTDASHAQNFAMTEEFSSRNQTFEHHKVIVVLDRQSTHSNIWKPLHSAGKMILCCFQFQLTRLTGYNRWMSVYSSPCQQTSIKRMISR